MCQYIYRNGESQLCLIRVLDKISDKLTLPQIDLTIDTISDRFVNHNNIECRVSSYFFLHKYIYIYICVCVL